MPTCGACLDAYSGNTALAVLTDWYGHCNASWSEGYLTSAGLSANDMIVIGHVVLACDHHERSSRPTGCMSR